MVARHAKPDSAGRYCNTACGTQIAMRAYRRRLKRKWPRLLGRTRPAHNVQPSTSIHLLVVALAT
jgi:hypothetical protein